MNDIAIPAVNHLSEGYMKDIAILAALIGLAGALLGSIITNYWTDKRQRAQHAFDRTAKKDDIIRSRAEELYELFDKFRQSHLMVFVALNAETLNLLEHKTFPITGFDSGFLQYALKKTQEDDQYYGRKGMIVNAYFPELKSKYQEYKIAASSMSTTMSNFLSQYVQGNKLSCSRDELAQFNQALTEGIETEKQLAQEFTDGLFSILSKIGDSQGK